MAEEGGLSPETRFRFAAKAFSHTAEYDGAISNYLTGLDAGSFGGILPDNAKPDPRPPS